MADLKSKRRAPQKNVAVENYRKRLKNATIEPEAGARTAPGDEFAAAAPQARQGTNLDILELFSIVKYYILSYYLLI